MNLSLEAPVPATPDRSDSIPQVECAPISPAVTAGAPSGEVPGSAACDDADPGHARWGARTVIAAPQGIPAGKRIPSLTRSITAIGLSVGLIAALMSGMQSEELVSRSVPVAASASARVTYTPPAGSDIDRPVAVDPRASPSPPVAVPRRSTTPQPPAFSIERSPLHSGVATRARDEAALHFRQGNAYASDRRWSEARIAYARAVMLEEQADYAFNLAVSLEHLGRTADALVYYRAALAAAPRGRTSFDPRRVADRVALLSQGGGNP